MKVRELFENPTFVNKEMPRVKMTVGLMSIDTIDRDWEILESFAINKNDYVILLRNELDRAIIGKWVLRDDNKKCVELVVALDFKEKQNLSYPEDITIPGKVLQVEVVEILDERAIALGFGYKLYKAILDAGYTLISDNTQFRGGKALWQKIVKRSALDNHNVYILQQGKLILDNNEKPIKYDGNNIPDEDIWGPG